MKSSDPGKRRHARGPTRFPQPGRVAARARPDKFMCHHKRGVLFPIVRDAHVRRHGVSLHDEIQEAGPVVAPGDHPDHVRVRVLLRGGGSAVFGECGRFGGRNRIAGDIGIPMFHVAEDEEAQNLWADVVD